MESSKHDNVRYLLYLGACIGSNTFEHGISLIEKYGLDNKHHEMTIELLNTMIPFYGTMGNVDKAVNLFENIPNDKKNIICTNAMMKCFNTNGKYS